MSGSLGPFVQEAILDDHANRLKSRTQREEIEVDKCHWLCRIAIAVESIAVLLEQLTEFTVASPAARNPLVHTVIPIAPSLAKPVGDSGNLGKNETTGALELDPWDDSA